MPTEISAQPAWAQAEKVIRVATPQLSSTRPKPTILIIEDDKSIHTLYRVALDEEDYAVVSCYDGAAGIAIGTVLHPDLIILDLSLPDISGVTVCNHLKASMQTADIPVMFVTGSTEMDEMLCATDLKAIDFVVKPFEAGDLRTRVEAALRRMQSAKLPSAFQFGDAPSVDALYESTSRPTQNQSWTMLEQLADQAREKLSRLVASHGTEQ